MKLPKWLWILLAVVGGLPIFFVLIGILAGLLLPATRGALARSNEVHAENTAHNLKNAIASFFTEYRDYPILDPAKDHTVDSGHALMDILLGSDKQRGPGGRNPRGVAFYTDKAAKPLGGGRFRKGLTLDRHGGGELWDPWGNPYRVRFDTDGSNRISNPDPTIPAAFLPDSIDVWSAGPDGDFDTWEDNVKTW